MCRDGEETVKKQKPRNYKNYGVDNENLSVWAFPIITVTVALPLLQYCTVDSRVGYDNCDL